MIKQKLRKAARKMAAWPIVGRFVRIAVAVIRLPELRTAYLNSQYVFETEQLPKLLQTLSDLKHKQLANDNDKDNLVRSVPVALRKITRDLIEVRGQVESVFSSIDQRLNETHMQMDSVFSSMNQRLNETHGQSDSISSSISYLFGRVEFVRRELMFEMRYGAKAPNAQVDQIKTKVQIINPEKLTVARDERLRLNLGCGHIALEDYLNVDRRALPGVDIVAEVDELPFGAGEVDEIFSAHLLEHFPQEQLRRELLPYWIGLLKHGGVLHSVVPDAESMITGYSKGLYPYASLREVTFGAQDYDGDFHFNMFVTEQIELLLKEAGLVEIEWLAKGRKNGACFEMEFRAVKK